MPESGSPKDLTDLTLEELGQITTTASRKAQPAWQTANAIYVVGQEEIRRSGATTIPEVLRMVPGLNVARIDSSRWAVSSRGFNDFFANKLLVLMDGRSVYTPLFSGVFWDVQNTVLEDIERIEVIRGPGASLWGANAVNGIINIITKRPQDTQGTLLSGGYGTEERGFGMVRYGGKAGEDLYYRVYGTFFNRDDSPALLNGEEVDEWDLWRTGFRVDWEPTIENLLTLQGDVYSGSAGQQLVAFTSPIFDPQNGRLVPQARILRGKGVIEGGNVLSRFRHHFSDTSDLTLQMYYDRTEREDRVHHEVRNTFDVDMQHRFGLTERQEILWGAGYRYTRDDLRDGRDDSGSIQFFPPERGDQTFSAFVQDEIAIIENELRLTLGTKLEHNDYTEFEIQPSGRLAWTPVTNQTVWFGISRAIRSPARFEHTIATWYTPVEVAPNVFLPTQLQGNSRYDSEELLAYELGYRVQPLPSVSADLALFYNEYDKLRGIAPDGIQNGVVIFRPQNIMDGETYGAELNVNWYPVEEWRLSAGYTLLRMNMHSPIMMDEVIEGDSPEHQFNVRSYLNLPHGLEFDTALFYVDSLPNRGVQDYFRLDARIGWVPNRERRNFEVSLVFQNLLDPRHPEFGEGFLVFPTEVERSVYAKVTWRF